MDVVGIDQNAWWMFPTTKACGLISMKDAGFFSQLASGRKKTDYSEVRLKFLISFSAKTPVPRKEIYIAATLL